MASLFDKTSVEILEQTAGTTLARVIEFYLPNNFRKTVNGSRLNSGARISSSFQR
jgi:hypothetical protein